MNPIPPGWVQDVLGPGFRQTEFPVSGDEEGQNFATLVTYKNPKKMAAFLRPSQPLFGVDILYVHGWNDYFFNRETAQFFEQLGAKFYALDLRKYGRSLRPWQTPGFVRNLGDHFEELDIAVDIIRDLSGKGWLEPSHPNRKLLLMGHSAGALILALWLAERPGLADGFILNAPWLEFQAHSIGRLLVGPLLDFSEFFTRQEVLPRLNFSQYGRVISQEFGGEWDYNTTWKPHMSFATPIPWLKSVFDGQARIERGLNLQMPMIVLLSDKSMIKFAWDEEKRFADTAIDVNLTAKRALNLGDNVQVLKIPGAIHEVFLSAKPIREQAYSLLKHWLIGVVT